MTDFDELSGGGVMVGGGGYAPKMRYWLFFGNYFC